MYRKEYSMVLKVRKIFVI
jgi:hypothetical protein